MCDYRAVYYFDDKDRMIYVCPHEPLEPKCMFHDGSSFMSSADNVRKEFYKMVEDAINMNKPLYCIGFYLPDIRLSDIKVDLKFTIPVYFSNAKFQQADFLNVQFQQYADFSNATFQQADFSGATFQNAKFLRAKFQSLASFHATFQEANFLHAIFEQEAYFTYAQFQQYANFRDTKFQRADFSGARFQYADFSLAEFQQYADFSNATFQQADFSGATFQNANFYSAQFQQEADFLTTIFQYVYFKDTKFQNANFSNAKFQKAYFSNAQFQQQADFSYAEFGEVDFININFPNNYIVKGENNKLHINRDIPIKFYYSTFRGRTRFIGENDNEPLDLSNVSFKGVTLDNVEFHNVKWREDRVLGFIKRNVIVDELLMDVMNNYQEVSRIYNQLRKNYEMQLLFNEASHFFIGEMEAIRRSLSKKGMSGILGSIPYLLYKYIALYGENVFLPLVVWTPAIIIGFAILRTLDGMCYDYNCVIEHVIDSIAAYFQVPRDPQRALDIIERILAVPILGSAFIAIKRRFERRK